MRLRLLAWLCVLAAPLSAQSPYDGEPTFGEADKLGYYVWRDSGTWHVRWVSLDHTRRFSGSVEALGGEIRNFKKIDSIRETTRSLPTAKVLTIRVAGPRTPMSSMTADFVITAFELKAIRRSRSTRESSGEWTGLILRSTQRSQL